MFNYGKAVTGEYAMTVTLFCYTFVSKKQGDYIYKNTVLGLNLHSFLFLVFILLLTSCSSNSGGNPTKTTQPASEPSSQEETTASVTPSTSHRFSIDYFMQKNKCSQVIDKEFYSICYDYMLKGSKAVAYTLSGDLVNEQNIEDSRSYKVERQIDKKYRAATTDYVNSGYDRGHIAPDAAFDWSNESLDSVYSLANIMPQARKVNRYTWTKAERLARFMAVKLGQVTVVNVLIYDSAPERIGQNRIAVPKGYYKILFNHQKNYLQCLYYANEKDIDTSKDRLSSHQVSCSELTL